MEIALGCRVINGKTFDRSFFSKKSSSGAIPRKGEYIKIGKGGLCQSVRSIHYNSDLDEVDINLNDLTTFDYEHFCKIFKDDKWI